MIKIEDMMTRHPHTLTPTNTIEEARAFMEKHDIHHLPIVDQHKKIRGIVSQRDILQAQHSCLNRDISPSTILLSHPLSEIMHTQMITVSPNAGLKESALFMQKHKVGCLPVIHHDRLVGIITDSDFVAIAINLLELQEEVEPDEVDEDAEDSF
ncbi:CBS domain-containing protein [Vibrio mangrovi]|uniref:CBS domain-containing protein n=1 Tax=Vibrio mangrovi TaxID=474394 RepID=A0A1Y6IQU8_9VIBR|nr:CBS domain-containing protein [Vibrio mangrovi]MDW6003183.1 CBS domain-containing protein [Vibrio mangrovi]SMS00029.1 Hypoxic response protein 1 [Vibrio mangrovi]